MTDGASWHVVMNDPEKTTVRSAWLEFGTGSAKNMDNEGGRPFLFPGKVPGYENMFPDIERVKPEYFRYVDRKIDYLNQRDSCPSLKFLAAMRACVGKGITGGPIPIRGSFSTSG